MMKNIKTVSGVVNEITRLLFVKIEINLIRK